MVHQLLIIKWGSVAVQVAYLVLSLSILVILHEAGHYLPAKLFKCKVEKFYLFFDPWFSLFKKKIGETVYGIGWLPLGGYVKISGMIDESMDAEQLKQPPQPWEFRSKPAWQRLIIMLGGVTVNILLAFFIYAMVLYTWGEEKLPNAKMKYGIAITDSLMYKFGLRDGDQILAVNDEPVPYFEDVAKRLLVGKSVTVERNGEKKTIQLPVDLLGQLIEKKRSHVSLFEPRVPVIVGELPDTLAAARAGMKPMDRIVGIDSVSTPFFNDLKRALGAKKGDSVDLQVERDHRLISLRTRVSENGTLGFYVAGASTMDSLGVFKLERKDYGFFESFPAGVSLALDNLRFYVDQLKKILHPETGAYKGLGGFKAIGSIMPQQWGDWQSFWSITALLSLILAVMNLLPIPALDGGHVLFTLYEMISGRKPSEKFLQYAQVVGMILLVVLLVYANGNDWFGWGKGK